MLINKKYKVPTCKTYWEKKTLPGFCKVDKEFWSKIYKLPHWVTRKVNIQAFQYKIINNVTNCGKKTKRLVNCVRRNVQVCGVKDTLLHYFMHCNNANSMRKQLITWYNSFMDVKNDINGRNLTEFLIFGFDIKVTSLDIFNFILLEAKYYIYKQ